MQRAAITVATLVLTARCAGLRPLPPAGDVACADASNVKALAWCIGMPDAGPRESGFRSTFRVAVGDFTRRVVLNQSPNLACNRKPWRGFQWMDEDIAGAAPLRAFVHEGREDRPIVVLVHGIFDSNSNRYIRYVASALAEQDFGVVVPDMRWHGCLFTPELLATAGIDEATDLVRWGAWLRDRYNRPVGLVGFSLGALDVINAMARTEARDVFAAGAIAMSPPAFMSRVVERLDRQPHLADAGGNALHMHYFRSLLRRRLRRAGVATNVAQPFAAYLDLVVRTHAPPFPATREELVQEVEPVLLLPRVRRPLLIIAAINDPVMTEVSSSALKEAAASLHPVAVIETPEGGHLGHLGRDRQWFVNLLGKFFTHAPAIAPV